MSIDWQCNGLWVLDGTLAAVSDDFVPGLRYESRAQELWALIVQSFGSWENRINAAASEAGISPVSAWALVQLDPEHPISQKELASRLQCNPSTVVDPTDRLEDAGLVVRQAQSADRRVNFLLVTPAGKRVRDQLIEKLFEPPDAFRQLGPEHLGVLRDAMRKAVSGG
jgi:DNA-binding MarR family transcriptional regulator